MRFTFVRIRLLSQLDIGDKHECSLENSSHKQVRELSYLMLAGVEHYFVEYSTVQS